jgi:hypothetical protein
MILTFLNNGNINEIDFNKLIIELIKLIALKI